MCPDVTTPTTPCKYLGADLPCTGILTNDSIEVAFQKLSEYVCSLTLIAEKNKPVYYSTTALPVIPSDIDPPYVLPTAVLIDGTSYTIPADGAGDYEILYVAEYSSTEDGGQVTVKFLKNSLEYSVIVNKTIYHTPGYPTIAPFTLFASSIPLVAGDNIKLVGSSTKGAIIKNAVFKVTKLN